MRSMQIVLPTAKATNSHMKVYGFRQQKQNRQPTILYHEIQLNYKYEHSRLLHWTLMLDEQRQHNKYNSLNSVATDALACIIKWIL